MNPTIRIMHLDEVGIIINYFHSATLEHLELLGVDPALLPQKKEWKAMYEAEYKHSIEKRTVLAVIWELEGSPVGFSTADKILFGKQANMHLHIVNPELRKNGIGSQCVKETVHLYFKVLELKQLFCEPNAFNVAPNRTLQRSGFKYVKTHQTIPGPLNYHQTVNRWLIEEASL